MEPLRTFPVPEPEPDLAVPRLARAARVPEPDPAVPPRAFPAPEPALAPVERAPVPAPSASALAANRKHPLVAATTSFCLQEEVVAARGYP